MNSLYVLPSADAASETVHHPDYQVLYEYDLTVIQTSRLPWKTRHPSEKSRKPGE